MREILFRARVIDSKSFITGFLIKQNVIRKHYKSGHVDLLVIPETIGQFTGILDVKGNKIFEGDVLEFPFDLGQAYVIYDGIRFAVKSEGSEAIDYEPSEVLKQCEIIGNIHNVK